MAGGKGERLKTNCEKPIYPIKGKPLIDYVISNINQSKIIDNVVVAVSPHTSNTKDYLIKEYSMKKLQEDSSFKDSKFFYFETPGNGYVEDLSFILSFFENDSPNHTLFFINSDLPLVNSQIIDYVLDSYNKSSKPALSVSVPSDIFDEYGLDYSFEFNGNVPSGINILVSQDVIQEEEELIIRCMELAFNVNTVPTAISISKFL